MKTKYLLFALLQSVSATTSLPSDDISIDAQTSIEYNEQKTMCIAKGNVVVKRGEEQLVGEQITIYFKRHQARHVVERVEAIGKASLTSPQGTLSAQRLCYDIPRDLLEAFGEDIFLQTPRYTMTSDQSMRYCKKDHTGDAIGNVHFTEDDRSIKADNVHIVFEEDKSQSTKGPSLGQETGKLSSLLAKGHVVLSQEERQGFSETAEYDAHKGCAILRGKVRLRNGKDFATGEQAWIDFEQKKAGMRACAKQRVHLLLSPSNTSKKR